MFSSRQSEGAGVFSWPGLEHPSIFVAPGRRKTLAVARMGSLVLVLHLHVQSQAGQTLSAFGFKLLNRVVLFDLISPLWC